MDMSTYSRNNMTIDDAKKEICKLAYLLQPNSLTELKNFKVISELVEEFDIDLDSVTVELNSNRHDLNLGRVYTYRFN